MPGVSSSAGRLAAGHANRLFTSRLQRNVLTPLLVGGLCLFALRAAPAYSGRAPQADNSATPRQVKPGTGKPTRADVPNGLTIENMHIYNASSMETDGPQSVTLHGPDIHADITDPKRGTQINLIADLAVDRKRAEGHHSAELTGNVRYTIIQPIKAGDTGAGKRILKGVAQRATYNQATNTLRLLGGVDAVLTDPTRFDGPATLHAASLLMPGEGNFELTGNADTNDMRFTPHVAPPKAAPPAANSGQKPKPAAQPSNIHVHGFTTGHLEVGKNIRFDGPLVTIDTVNAKEKTQSAFKAPHITANLDKAQEQVEATGGIQFDNRNTDEKGNMQRMEGTAESATWNGTLAQLEADGNVNVTLTNPKTLLEPATLAVGHFHAEVSDNPRYVMTGSPERTRLTLVPKQGKRKTVGAQFIAPNAAPNTIVNPEHPTPNTQHPILNTQHPAPDEDNGEELNPAVNAPPKTPALPFAFGRMELTAFQTATYIPGQSIVVEGPKARFTSTDPATKSYAELLTPHLEAEFDADNTVKMTRATNTVDFRFEQPVKPNGKSPALNPIAAKVGSDKETKETIIGTAQTATFTNGEDAQIMTAEGVGRVAVANLGVMLDGTQFTSPSHDGSVNYNLTTRKIEMKNPSRDGGWDVFTVPPAQPVRPAAKPKKKRK